MDKVLSSAVYEQLKKVPTVKLEREIQKLLTKHKSLFTPAKIRKLTPTIVLHPSFMDSLKFINQTRH
jgi:hypothetical protein